VPTAHVPVPAARDAPAGGVFMPTGDVVVWAAGVVVAVRVAADRLRRRRARARYALPLAATLPAGVRTVVGAPSAIRMAAASGRGRQQRQQEVTRIRHPPVVGAHRAYCWCCAR
jgi:hypothetical protein